ncbi:hypothetical protein NQ315_012963 [Exocentrus adspersus]|uniref:Uncharacterized protein n=1 Tax=Exocentrus adspersus TaxID=1586481 RepID=A0AAV8VSD8_9CUCU|nr:hypothetical protein NQ315_012963 [Exocentrus adspersus]
MPATPLHFIPLSSGSLKIGSRLPCRYEAAGVAFVWSTLRRRVDDRLGILYTSEVETTTQLKCNSKKKPENTLRTRLGVWVQSKEDLVSEQKKYRSEEHQLKLRHMEEKHQASLRHDEESHKQKMNIEKKEHVIRVTKR